MSQATIGTREADVVLELLHLDAEGHDARDGTSDDVDDAIDSLAEALGEGGRTLEVRRIHVTDPADARALGIASPLTILVNGADITPDVAEGMIFEAVMRRIAGARPLHRAVDTGPAFWGPGDRYTFLVTGEESGGAYFAMEAFVPPGGGPPPHIHRREDETFYLIEGEIEFQLGDRVITAGPGDFVSVPRGTVHCFHNVGTEPARMVLTFTPAGMEHFFEEALVPVSSDAEEPPREDDVAARYIAAAPRYGLEFA